MRTSPRRRHPTVPSHVSEARTGASTLRIPKRTAPGPYEVLFPSLAHTAEHVERTVDAAAAAFGEIA